MPQQSALKSVIFERTGPALMARLVGNDGEYVTRSNISAVKYTCRNRADVATELLGGSLVVNDVIFNTLVTNDARWTVDTTGYNFLLLLTGAAFPEAGDYIVEVMFTPTSGEKFFLQCQFKVRGIQIE